MIDTYVRQYETASARGEELPAWLRSHRAESMGRFRAAGFPGPKDEEWRFTPVGPLVRSVFAVPPAPGLLGLAALEGFLFDRPDWARVVLVDGQFVAGLSRLPQMDGLRVASFAGAAMAEWPALEGAMKGSTGGRVTPFAALNGALGTDGAVIEVAAGAVMESPVHVLHVATGIVENAASHPRLLVVVGAAARAQVVESYVALDGVGRYWTNPVCEVRLDRDAWVEHTRIQRESDTAFHTGVTEVSQAGGSHYRSFTFAMGGAIARHDLRSRLGGSGAEALLYGLYFGRGDQLVDNHTTIFHDEPDCRSWEVYKGILSDRAHGVFNGKIIVQPAAQKTDAKQTNRALLLSDTAKIDTKPQLEIFADDVKCTHGATVGNLDPMAEFYLKSRGIPADQAGQLLTYAFAAEVLNEISAEPVRTALDSLVRSRLRSGR